MQSQGLAGCGRERRAGRERAGGGAGGSAAARTFDRRKVDAARPPARAAALFARARARCDSTYFIESRRASRWIVSFSFFFWIVSARESSSTASAWRSMWPRAELRSRLRSPTRLCALLRRFSWCRFTNEWHRMSSNRQMIIGTPSQTARRTQQMLWSDLKHTGADSACEQSG